MEFKEVEQALEELEGRIERLKALYEQYFMGIEKLEPLVPRKDVDRRVQILRREQVRNTAQRFKFNTLVQRYNSFQQYWARVAREIENGTYHRDVARAAARFGAKDALTIFGKKQAEKYQRLVANQEERKARRLKTHTIDEEMLADDELLFVEDEPQADAVDDIDDESRPTPVVPGRGAAMPPMPAIPPAPPPPRATAPTLLTGMVPPPLPPVARASGQIPPPVVNMKADITEEIDLDDAELVDVVEDKPTRARKAIRPETMFPIMMRRPAEQVQKVPDPTPQEPAQRSPSIPPNAEAGKKRAAALAAQVKQRASSTMVPQASRPLDLELDLGQGARAPQSSRALDLDFGDTPTHQDKPAAKVAKPERALDLDLEQGTRGREETQRKIDRLPAASPPPGREEKPSSPGRTEVVEVRAPIVKLPEIREALSPESTRTPASVRGEDPRAAGARVAAAARERAASAREESAGEGGLSETRMRQIYGEYVAAKRAVKESTAGVTFDTLSQQLKQQAQKLEASHPGRKVDYSVVMKNGKPTLKPILR